jgi:anti-sigma regulatory factor (Ser/Thr protein kinase)
MPSSAAVPELVGQRSFPAATASIREARRFVKAEAAAVGASGTTLDDIELASSELASNAVEHGSGSTFQVSVILGDAHVDVEVTSEVAGRIVADPADWIGPAADSITGRGLNLVKMLSEDTWVRTLAGSVTIGCRFATIGTARG